MTVSELIEMLKEVDGDREVFISSDEEGNSYRTANFDDDALMCNQDNEWVSVHPQDLADGEYEGWEEDMVKGVMFW